MTETETLSSALLEAFVPRWFHDFRHKTRSKTEEEALNEFQTKINAQQIASGYDQPQRAAGFDYVRWKQSGHHRMHQSSDEYVRTCQGLAPYISAVSSTAWEGMEEKRWAGLTSVPPDIQGMMPKSTLASRSNFGSRDDIAGVPR